MISKDNSTFNCKKCLRPIYTGAIHEFDNCYQGHCIYCGYVTELSKWQIKKSQKKRSQIENACSQNENVLKKGTTQISTGCAVECAT